MFDNRGGRRLQFADLRPSSFIRPNGYRRRLRAADETCGYAFATLKSPIEVGACLALIRTFEVKPHGSASQTITLFKGLRGMERLAPGTYVFEKPIRFRPGRDMPASGTGRTAVLKIIYEIDRAAA